MRQTLALWLGGDSLALELLEPSTLAWLPPFLRRGAAPQSKARAELAGPAGAKDIRSRLAQALLELQTSNGDGLAGTELKVQLGFAYSHVGLVRVDDQLARTLDRSLCDACARGWVAETLHLEPQAQIVRWEAMTGGKTLMVSAVDREVYEALEEICLQHQLVFSSCRPAILSAVAGANAAHESAVGAPSESFTLVCTERAGEAGWSRSVQLLRIRRNQVLASWRGWLPADNAAELNAAMEGAVRRFQATNFALPTEVPSRLQLPLSSPVKTA